MKTFECKNCGSTDLKYKGGVYTCKYCDSKFHVDKPDKEISQESFEPTDYVTIHRVKVGNKQVNNIKLKVYKDGCYVQELSVEKCLKIPLEKEATISIVSDNRTMEGLVEIGNNTHIIVSYGLQFGGFTAERNENVNDMEAEAIMKRILHKNATKEGALFVSYAFLFSVPWLFYKKHNKIVF